MATQSNLETFLGGFAKILGEKWQVDLLLKAGHTEEGEAISAHKLVRASPMDELWKNSSSLYNELKTSENAKRQQPRFCGPVVAMSFNFIVAVGIILANKLVMGRVGFNFPILLTLIHYTVAFFKSLSLLPMSPPSKTTPFSSLFSLGAVMAFASGLANTSLKHNSVGFYQMAKIAVTPTIVLMRLRIRAARSEVFKKMLESDKFKASDGKIETVTLSELKQEELEALVEFIYDNRSLLSEKEKKHVQLLYKAADKYEIPHLQDLCRNELIASLNSSNVLNIFELSYPYDQALMVSVLNYTVQGLRWQLSRYFRRDSKGFS